MKEITFDGVKYKVYKWVSWIVRHQNGVIKGYQYEPFEAFLNGEWTYEYSYGQEMTLYKPATVKVAV